MHAGISVRADLARVFDCTAGCFRGNPEHLQHAARALAADRRRCWITIAHAFAEALGPAHAELPITLEVACAVVERVEEVPHPYQVGKSRGALELSDRPIDGAGCPPNDSVSDFVRFDDAEKKPGVVGVANHPRSTTCDRTTCAPHGRGHSALHRLEADVDSQDIRRARAHWRAQ